MSNPILENKRNLFIYAAIWVGFALGDTLLFMHFYDLPFSVLFIDGLVYYLSFGPIGIGLWYVVYYSDIFKNKISRTIFNHVITCIFVTVFWSLFTYFILRSINASNSEYLEFLNKNIPFRSGMGMLLYILFVLFFYLVIYYRSLKEKMIRESELKALVKESELGILKSQINPHFLFNSLNSISSLTITDPEKAQEMVIKLSDFFRYSLGNRKEDKSSLKDELQNIDRYLAIEKTRFGEKLKYEKHVNEECLTKLVPGMILQPLFENAVKYGVYESLEESGITLTCTSKGLFLHIQIENDYDAHMLAKKGEGIGLSNIRQRLRLLYSRNDLLTIQKTDKRYIVTLLIPQTI
ncbi:MAG: histidine kinase [Bacteroidales bacterium]|nr:histidine kinase [Bacteroidales bacterium]